MLLRHRILTFTLSWNPNVRNISAIDYSPNIEHAKRLNKDPRVEFQVGDACAPPLRRHLCEIASLGSCFHSSSGPPCARCDASTRPGGNVQVRCGMLEAD